ncbi:MAG: N-acetyltransferase [Comamonadaceae bacterium]|nr:MAG: N-acetyltransferase [Comamonadaceae bacterium]
MASTERAQPLGALDAATLAMLDALVVHSHWNQTSADWQLFARQGRIHGVRNAQGRIVASGAVLPMGEREAWVSMILVEPACRGRGLGRTVFEACLQDIEERGRTAWLDATPAGEALYVQHGFTALWRLARWQRPARPATTSLSSAGANMLAALAALDADALGFARPAVLRDLATREGACVVRRAEAFALVRRGRVAHHVGPLIATGEPAAADLLRHIASGLDTAVFVDVPDARTQLHAVLAGLGFTRQRPFARMVRGAAAAQGQTAFIHAIAGPEYG